MTFSILLSLILVLGGAQGPSGDFDQSTATSDSVTASPTTTSTDTTVKPSKKG